MHDWELIWMPSVVVYWSEASSQLEVCKVRLLWSLHCPAGLVLTHAAGEPRATQPDPVRRPQQGLEVWSVAGSARLGCAPSQAVAVLPLEVKGANLGVLLLPPALQLTDFHTWECLKKGMIFSENSESIRCHCLPSWILLLILGMCVRD